MAIIARLPVDTDVGTEKIHARLPFFPERFELEATSSQEFDEENLLTSSWISTTEEEAVEKDVLPGNHVQIRPEDQAAVEGYSLTPASDCGQVSWFSRLFVLLPTIRSSTHELGCKWLQAA